MSHDTTNSTGVHKGDVGNLEQNILGPRMYEQSPSYVGTSEGTHPEAKRRAARVGLRSGKGRQYTWKEKLDARILHKGEGCWEVSGYGLPHNGYVQIRGARNESRYAHRLAWELEHGPLPDGLVVAHTCDNPRCVRPLHLVATTQAENIHDAVRKGRYNVFGIQKLNAEQVLAIREAAANGESQKTIAARFGIARNTVSGIVNHKSWAHLTKPINGPRPAAEVVPISPSAAVARVFERVPCVDLPVLGEVR